MHSIKKKRAAYYFLQTAVLLILGLVVILPIYIAAVNAFLSLIHISTKFVENFDGWSLVPEIVLAPGEYSLPSGMQTYMDKSFQNIFNGADITGELENWDAEYERLIEGQ